MATYIDALNGKHSDGSEQFSDTITLLVKHTQYFTVEVHPDRIDEIGSWQDVIDLDIDELEFTPTQEDSYEFEFIKVIKDNT